MARAKAQAVMYERQAARHAEPAGTLAHDSAAPTPAKLPPPASYDSLRRAAERAAGHLDELDGPGTLLFLHELTTSTGVRRIVAVRYLPWAVNGPPTASLAPAASGLVAEVFEAGGWLGGGRLVGSSHAPILMPVESPTAFDGIARDCRTGDLAASLGGLRWFAGEPDPADPTHFTLGFDFAGRGGGTVDGYLTPDGSAVRMTVRPAAREADADPFRSIAY